MILKYLSDYLERFPDMRFCQALYNLGIIWPNCDQYYEESVKTLEGLVDQVKNHS